MNCDLLAVDNTIIQIFKSSLYTYPHVNFDGSKKFIMIWICYYYLEDIMQIFKSSLKSYPHVNPIDQKLILMCYCRLDFRRYKWYK